MLDDQDIEISIFELHGSVFVLGCASCQEGQGWLRLYDSSSLTLLYEVEGAVMGQSEVAQTVRVVTDDLNITRVFYSSR